MNNDIVLRDAADEDIPAFFEHQIDPEANYIVAFVVTRPEDWDRYAARWDRIMADPSIIAKAILFRGNVAGHIVSFERFGRREVGYWLGREYWGKGIATEALSKFLKQVDIRPLSARVAKDNIASVRVLEKCGFVVTGEDKAFSEVRGADVEEFIMELNVNDNRAAG